MLILHLTDLHLADKAYYDDHKGPVDLDIKEDPYNIQVLGNTLAALAQHLTDQEKELGAIIISGDITTANSEEGYKALEGVLDRLGDHRPPPNRIMIVPGNHDVTWGVKESTREKYKFFLEYIKKKKYIIPYLDSIASNKNQTGFLNFDDLKVQFVLINSSNYCGLDIFEGIDKTKIDQLTDYAATIIDKDDKDKKVSSAIKKVRIHDIARISQEQITWLEEALAKDKERKDYLKIAILHHHISAVSPHEEFKSTENITNTGLLYSILRNNNFSIVLHGHKHKGLIYNLAIPDYNKAHNTIVDHHNICVISGSAINKDNKSDIGRLLEIEELNDKVVVNYQSFDGIEKGNTKLMLTTRAQIYPITPKYEVDSDMTTTVISGKTLDDTYEKILAHFEKIEEETAALQIITEIQTNNGDDLYAIPRGYKFPGDRQVSKEWLEEIVNWWKRPTTTLNVPFTHGQRLYRYGSSYAPIDQFAGVKQFIVDKIRRGSLDSSARAFVNLHNPEIDRLDNEKIKSPQLSCIQFTLSKDGNKTKLNAIAYFRKQELRYWWAVNIAEIKSLLFEIVNECPVNKVEIGSITTFSGMGYVTKRNASPEVAPPKLDILFDDYNLNSGQPNQFWGLAYSLVNPNMPHKKTFQNLWNDVLTDLQPREEHDDNTIPVSIEGLENIAAEIQRYIGIGGNPGLKNILADLQDLLATNRRFKTSLDDKGGHLIEKKYKAWREECLEKTKKLLGKIDKLFEGSKSGTQKPASKGRPVKKASSKNPKSKR